MNRLALINGRAITPSGVLKRATLLIEDGRIAALQSGGTGPFDGKAFDARGLIVAPGFLEMHVHGEAGYDTMDATPRRCATWRSFARLAG
jgi:N-acetylglucosamine-6-phosphate deacetylase